MTTNSEQGKWKLVAPIYWGVLAIATGFMFLDATQGSFRIEALKDALGLSLGALALALAGWSMAVLGGMTRFTGNAPLLIGIGQIGLVAWLYFRSLVNVTASSLGLMPLPVSALELFAGVALLLLWATKKNKFSRFVDAAPSFLWVLAVVLIIAQRELPRELMLSTDPDQHLFWALQVLKFGGVPFQLGDWGSLSFEYPAGYAVLCAMWAWLSFISAANAVTIQPLLQSALAVLALANLVSMLLGSETAKGKAWLGFLAVALFFGFFPASLLKEFYILQKTGSLSTLLLFVSILALLAHHWMLERRQYAIGAICLAGLGVGWSALINPIAFIIPAIFFYGSLLYFAWRGRGDGIRNLIGILVVAIIPVALMLSDPYYAFRFVAQRPVVLAEIPPNFAIEPLVFGQEIVNYVWRLINRGEFARPLMLLQYFAHPGLAIVFMAVLVAAVMAMTRQGRRRKTAGYIIAVPVICVALQFMILPLFYAVRNKGDLYLLEPYFMEAINRLAYIWYLSVLFVCGALILRRAEEKHYGMLALACITALALIPVRQLRDVLPNQVKAKPRHDFCPIQDCQASDDEVIVRALNLEYKKEMEALQTGLTEGVVPRVLVPNQLTDVWRERWLFPVGSAKNLVSKTDFPLAFFYYKGDADFSYRNYVERVCNNFDVEWLKLRRIKYVYLPSDRENACVSGLEDLLDSDQLIAKSGKSALIRIY